MRNIVFVGHNISGACKMRGLQTVQALEKYNDIKASYILGDTFVETVNNIKDSIIIFVGEPLHIVNNQMLETLSKNNNNNILIYDVIDNFCFNHTNIFYNNEEIEYPTYFEFPMVDEVEIEIPIYEDIIKNKISKYYDFDEHGDIVEKTKEEEFKTTIQIGTQTITKQKINVNKENVYSFAYNLVKEEFSKIFGNENIIDE